MRALLRMECAKAFRNRWFLAALGVGVACALVSAVGNILFVAQSSGFPKIYEDEYMFPYISSPFRWWMSLDGLQPSSTVFYEIALLLAVCAYAWSFRTEHDSGYLNQVCSRASRARYYVAKAVAVFLSAAAVVVMPQVINFAVLATYFPLYTPSAIDGMYYGVYPQSIGAGLYFNAPWLYVALYLSISGAIAGAWATFVLALSFFIKNRVVLLVAPFVGLQVFSYLNVLVFSSANVWGFQLGLPSNMRGMIGSYDQTLPIIVVEVLLLLAVSALIPRLCLRRDVL